MRDSINSLRALELFIAQEKFLKGLVPGLKVKFMWKWLAKLWPFGAFIIWKTVFIKKDLPYDTQTRLVAHDTVHIWDKMKMGLRKYKLGYMFDKRQRLIVETRGYGLGAYIYGKQGGDKGWIIGQYTDLLYDKYKLTLPKVVIRSYIVHYAYGADHLDKNDIVRKIVDWWDRQTENGV